IERSLRIDNPPMQLQKTLRLAAPVVLQTQVTEKTVSSQSSPLYEAIDTPPPRVRRLLSLVYFVPGLRSTRPNIGRAGVAEKDASVQQSGASEKVTSEAGESRAVLVAPGPPPPQGLHPRYAALRDQLSAARCTRDALQHAWQNVMFDPRPADRPEIARAH